MGTYKVPQNVEAEDKILGPLSMKQFIYAMIGVAYGLLTFAILHSLSLVLWGIIGLPPMLALLGLGLYQREDQPLETFVVAIADFFVRPRQRLWEKEPISEVFRLEPPPPKPEQTLRDPRQVRSQLAELADLVDTRGWSVKEPELQEPDETPVVDLRDRIGSEVLDAPPAIAPMSEVSEADDMLSGQTPAAQDLNTLIENTVQSVRAEAMEKMHATTAAPIVASPATTTPSPPAAVSGALVAATVVVAQPASAPAATPAARQPAIATPSISSSTAAPSGDILKLATEGGDLTVAQIAAQARRYSTLNEGQAVSLRQADAI
jgi:hypothetical protein